MKLKGISLIERHVEKVVLLVFSLVLAFVLVQQLGLLPGGQSTLNVGGQEVAIDRAPLAVRDIAQQKLAHLNSSAIDERIPASLPDPSALFASALNQPTPNVRLASLGQPQITVGGTYTGGGDEPGDSMENVVFAQVTPPALSKPLTRVHGCAVDPLIAAETGPELLKLLPPQQPYDVRAVSIETRFDAEKFREMLANPGEGIQPVPPNFWQGRSEILDVVFVRQELGSDGQWVNETELAPLPGRFALRDSIAAETVEPTQLRDILTNERTNRADVRRPAFYSAVSGEPWVWPSFGVEEARDPAEQDRINRLVNLVRSVRADIERVLKLLETPAGGTDDSGGRDPQSNRGDVDSEDDFQWPYIPRTLLAQFGGGGGGGAAPPPTRDREGERRKALEKRLEELRKREQDMIEELRGLGVDAEGRPLDAADRGVFSEPLDSLSQPSLLRVTLWTHDLTAEPGKTYRYQARVRITNPFFGQEGQLPADQRSLSEGLTLLSEPSEWSDPVYIEPNVVFYVRSANPASRGQVNVEARTSVDLFEFYYGYWRRAAANLNPGDVVAADADLPDLKTWEILRDESGLPVVGDSTELSTKRRVMSDAILLDVAGVPGGEKGTSEVYLAMAGGLRVAVQYVQSGAVEKDSVYALLRASSEMGLLATLSDPGTRLAGAGQPAGSPAGLPTGPGDSEDGSLPAGEDPTAPGSLPSRPEDF